MVLATPCLFHPALQMYSDEDREAVKGLDEFLAKIDEVGEFLDLLQHFLIFN